jgi:hypothetical protein
LSGAAFYDLSINFNCRIKITVYLLGIQSFLHQDACRLRAAALTSQAELQPCEGKYAYRQQKSDCENFVPVHNILLSSKIT